MTEPKRTQPNVTKFSALPERELLPFIKAAELTEIDRFTILGARLIEGGEFGAQWYFDIAFKRNDVVEKRCISLSVANDRDDIARRAQDGMITGVRLDDTFTRSGNKRWIFADADVPRTDNAAPEPAIPGLTDDDIPF